MKLLRLLPFLAAASAASNSTKYVSVPSYNISLPVDYNSSETFPNRYFVNDTYYKPGGPVILLDLGEEGASPKTVSQFLAEQDALSGPLRLAAKINGLVILWEHRYYGYSRPVKMNDTAGVPETGLDGYKHLTVDLALEDVAYFANHFNTTKLDKNKVVTNSSGLDPYNTPWIFVGGSYPGFRAIMSRLKHPEVFYAAWSSSALAEVRYDGGLYTHSIERALPRNCSDDIKAAVKYVDDVILKNQTQTKALLKELNTVTYLVTGFEADSPGVGDDIIAGKVLLNMVTQGDTYAYKGPPVLHTMCDAMQTFDAKSYQKSNSTNPAQAILMNPGKAKPSADGIAAKYDAATALAAWQFGIAKLSKSLPGGYSVREGSPTASVDAYSWVWQKAYDMGLYNGWSTDNATKLFSTHYKYTDDQLTQQLSLKVKAMQPDFKFPAKPRSAVFTNETDGWNVKLSNTMFTNGQYDPWLAYSVMSPEKEHGAPQRKVITDVPKCNDIPDGTDLFGILHADATHTMDLTGVHEDDTDVDAKVVNKPMVDSVDLFVKAWKVWAPCFNTSREDVRNGRGVDGKGNGSNGDKINGTGSGNGTKSGGGGDKEDGATGRAVASAAWMAVVFALFWTTM